MRARLLLLLCASLLYAQDPSARIDALFSEGGDESTVITLGTTHKLKGLEADRVWMLADTYRRNMGGEEANCWYVAVTRAKNHLFLVHKPEGAPAMARSEKAKELPS